MLESAALPRVSGTLEDVFQGRQLVIEKRIDVQGGQVGRSSQRL